MNKRVLQEFVSIDEILVRHAHWKPRPSHTNSLNHSTVPQLLTHANSTHELRLTERVRFDAPDVVGVGTFDPVEERAQLILELRRNADELGTSYPLLSIIQ